MREPTASSSYFKAFLRHAESQGFAAACEPFLRDAEQEYVTASRAIALIDSCLPAFEQPGVGLAIGSRYAATSHGVLSHLVLSANTHWEALLSVQQLLAVRTELFSFELVDTGSEIQLHLKLTPPLHTHLRLFSEAFMAGACRTILDMHEESPLLGVGFPYPAVDDPAPYRSTFGVEISFDAPCPLIRLNREVMLRPTHQPNPAIFSMAEAACRQQLAALEQSQPLIEHIRTLLLQNCLAFPSQEHMAKHLGMSTRSLRRQLQQQGTRYHLLLDQARNELAQAYLRERWDIERVADALGYSEPNNFMRAFKRWTGTTPSQFMAR